MRLQATRNLAIVMREKRTTHGGHVCFGMPQPKTFATLATLVTLGAALPVQAQPTPTDPRAPEAPAPAAPDSAAPPSITGLIFRVNQQITEKAQTAPEPGAGTATATATAPSTLESCQAVSVELTRGALNARNNSSDAQLTFSDLPPGPYRYTVRCQSEGVASQPSHGTVEVVANKLTPVDITVEAKRYSNVGSTFELTGAAISIRGGSPDQKGGELDSKSRDLTVLADLGYITSRGAHQGVDELAFTDLGVWSLAAALTPQRRLTFGAKVAGLTKSPVAVDGNVLQLAGGDISYAFAPHLAVQAAAQWRTGLGATRAVIDAGAGVTWRQQHAEFVKTEFSLGVQSLTHRTAMASNLTSGFVTGSAEVQLCWNDCRRRFGASWFGFDAAIPVAHSNSKLDLVGAKPNSALGFHVGSFMRVNSRFDLFADVAWHDRGESAAPKTEAGTLLGGFDQLQLSLGAIFYFHTGKHAADHSRDYVLAL